MYICMTVFAKTSLVCTKMKFMFLAYVIAILQRYPYTVSPVARFKCFAFLRGRFITLKSHKWDIITCAAHELGVISLKLFPSPEWWLLGLVVWLGSSCYNWWRISCHMFFLLPPHPFTLLNLLHPSTHSPTPSAMLALN